MTYNPLQILLAVQSLCPGLQVHTDFELMDVGDGNGPFISAWRRPDVVRPTQAQIQAVDTDALLAAQVTVLSQDLMAEFTPSDMVKINAAISADATGVMALLWFSMVAQRDPMMVGNLRFKQGWSVLTAVLGIDRMTAIAKSLKITVS